MEIGDGNAGRENGIVGVLRSKISSGFRCEIIEFHGCDAVVDTGDDFLCDSTRANQMANEDSSKSNTYSMGST